nr:hypothetical protein [Sphingobium sp. Leaf26]
MRILATLLAGSAIALTAGAAWAQDPGEGGDGDYGTRQPIIVTAPGGAVDIDDALTLTAADINRTGSPDILAALTRNFAGVTLQDAQNNPWQTNLVYRGFRASRRASPSIWTARVSTSPSAIRSSSTCCRKPRSAASPCSTRAPFTASMRWAAH